MQELYLDFIEWIKSIGLGEILSIVVSAFVAIFIPVANKQTTNAKLEALVNVANNKTLTENYDSNQKKTNEKIEELKSTIKELEANNKITQELLEKFGGIIALLIQNAKTDSKAKDWALKLFSIPTEKLNVENKEITTKEIVSEIVEEVQQEVKEKVEKEESGQFDSLVDDLLKDYEQQ